jgi:16S rRNA (guanine527-N7)-methyltransferase
MNIPTNRQSLVDIFLEKNSQINLSAIRDAEWVYIKHILDWLEVSNHEFTHQLFQNAKKILDVWTGGWFPLLPLAIHYPHIDCHGIDARKKKTLAVQDIATQAWLENVTLHRGRAEDKKLALWKYDIVTARWVTFADPLFDLCFRLTKRKWRMIRWKQFTYDEDAMVIELSNDVRIIDFKAIRYTLPGLEDQQRVLYCFKKS